MPIVNFQGCKLHQGLLTRADQIALVAQIRDVVGRAPLFSPQTKSGKDMSVRMTSAGRFGWVSDASGYRYSERHPNGVAWPAIPEDILNIWRKVAEVARAPECCLINYYGSDARMGLHQDKDEADFSMPVVSISLGDSALFRVGGPERQDPTRSIWLESGDVVVLSGPARRAFHGIDKVRFGSSRLLPNAGRINLTLRVVT